MGKEERRVEVRASKEEKQEKNGKRGEEWKILQEKSTKCLNYVTDVRLVEKTLLSGLETMFSTCVSSAHGAIQRI